MRAPWEAAVAYLWDRIKNLSQAVNDLRSRMSAAEAKASTVRQANSGRQSAYGFTEAGITGRSGTTLGSGTVTLYYSVGTTLTTAGHDVTCYNISSIAVDAEKYVEMNWNGNAWSVIVESCG